MISEKPELVPLIKVGRSGPPLPKGPPRPCGAVCERCQDGERRRCQDVCTSLSFAGKKQLTWPDTAPEASQDQMRLPGEKGSWPEAPSILLAGGFSWGLPRILKASGSLFETGIGME